MEKLYNKFLLQFLSNQSETSHKRDRHIEDAPLSKRKKIFLTKLQHFWTLKFYSVWLKHFGKFEYSTLSTILSYHSELVQRWFRYIGSSAFSMMRRKKYIFTKLVPSQT